MLTIFFLRHLEHSLASLARTNDKLLVHDLFDMFAGTSAGGMLATAVGLRRQSMSELSAVFNCDTMCSIFDKSFIDRLCGNVQFRPKYDGDAKTAALKRAIGERTRFCRNATGKFVLVPTYDLEAWESVFFVNHDFPTLSATTTDREDRQARGDRRAREDNWSGDAPLDHSAPLAYKVADATSAAPTYFPAVHLETYVGRVERAMPDEPSLRYVDSWFVDGGVNKNNPALTAALAARRHLRNHGQQTRPIRVLSLGTGQSKHFRKGGGTDDASDAEDFGGIQWMRNNLLQMLMDETHTHQEMQLFFDEPERDYVRVNGDLGEAGVAPDLDDTSSDNVDAIRRLSCKWWREHAERVYALLDLPFDASVCSEPIAWDQL